MHTSTDVYAALQVYRITNSPSIDEVDFEIISKMNNTRQEFTTTLGATVWNCDIKRNIPDLHYNILCWDLFIYIFCFTFILNAIILSWYKSSKIHVKKRSRRDDSANFERTASQHNANMNINFFRVQRRDVLATLPTVIPITYCHAHPYVTINF